MQARGRGVGWQGCTALFVPFVGGEGRAAL